MNPISHTRGRARINFSRHATLAVMLMFISTPLTAASFNCNKASTKVEKMICADPELSEADEQLAEAYRNLRKALPKSERALLKRDQRQWLKERNVEFRTCEDPYCYAFYLVRIEQLSPVAQAGFNCKKARSKPEKQICGSRLLRHADGRMAYAYKNYFFAPREQRKWLKSRNLKLRRSDCRTKCAWQVYKDRIEELTRHLVY